MPPCQHPYHISCFATLCTLSGSCLALGCNIEIPASVKMIFGVKTSVAKDEAIPIGMLSILATQASKEGRAVLVTKFISSKLY